MTDKSITDSSKTQTYSTGSDKTQVYGSEAAATQVYGQRDHAQSVIPETQTYESQESPLTDKTQAHNLGIGDSVELNEKKYEIVGIISLENQTLEAVIYKIRDDQSKIFALKLYYQFPNSRNEPNAEALRRIREIKDPDILHLHDFGTGGNKYQNKFCFEICDFAEGGDLLSVEDIKEKYTPEFLEANVVPEISKGIKRLHQHRIYHCDLTPRNVFFLDEKQEDLVIGDYGSAKTFEQDSEKSLARTSMTKGTDLYLAPEQARGIISEKNDYYSLGMSLLHLLYPEQFTKANFDKIIERQFAGREIINFDPIYDHINKLIAGLTLQDINRRWGKAEVEGWLDGEDIEVRYPSESAVAPIKLGKITIRAEGDLVKHIEGDDKWFDDLIDDEVGYGLLLTWLSNLQDFERRKTFDRMVRYYRLNVGGEEYTRKYVKEAVLRFFNPERPVQVEMRSYDFFGTDNLLQLVDQFWKHIDDIWKITDLQELKYYLFQFEFSLKQLVQSTTGNLKTQTSALIDKISAILDVSSDADFSDYQAVFHSEVNDERLIELFYTFNPERAFRDLSGKSHETIEKVGFFFADNQELFNNKYLRLETVRFLKEQDLNALSNKNYNDFLFTVFNEHIRAEIEFVGISFEDSKWTITYKFGKSLSDYLKQHSIDNSLVQITQRNDTLVLQRSIYTTYRRIFKDFINNIEQKHNIKKESISIEAKTKFKKDLITGQNEYLQKRRKAKSVQFFEYINLPSVLRSVAFLLPVYILLLLIIAFPQNDIIMSFFDIDAFIKGDSNPFKTTYAINFLLFFSSLPAACIGAKFSPSNTNIFDRKFCLSSFAVYLAIGPIILIAVMLLLVIVGCIPGWIIGAIFDIDLDRLAWKILLFLYVMCGIVLLGKSILSLYELEGQFQGFPFFLSVIPYILLSLFLFGFGTSPANLQATEKITSSKQQAHTEGTISVNAANVRTRPSTKARKLGTLHRGEKVSILSVEGNWYRISMSDSRKGYIYKKLVSLGGKTSVPLTKKPPRLKEKAERTSKSEKPIQQQRTQVGARKEPVRSTVVKPSTFSVNIQSRPQGAIVFIDQKKAGVTPFVVDLELGSHGVKLEKPGYRSEWDIFRVEKNGQKNFLFRLGTE